MFANARRLLQRAWLVPLLILSALVVAVPSADAFSYEWPFCHQSLAPDGTCPPNGESKYAHLELVEGDAGGASHETCVDAYVETNGVYGYDEQNCMYEAPKEARVFPEGKYGYPRAWNGGEVTHAVDATEYGYQ